MHPTGNKRIVDQMVTDGLLTGEQREAVLNVVNLGQRVEEAVLEVTEMGELPLLKYLAAHYKTRYVSSEKLAKADIDRVTLEKVPHKLADQSTVFPVLFDPQSGVLSVVTADPDDVSMLNEVQLVSNAREVRAFVGRPRAVRAAIAKAYQGDIHAFAALDRSAHEQFSTMLNVYERNLVSDESMAVALAEEGSRERMLSGQELEGSGSTGAAALGGEAYLETLNVLVSLLENARPDLRGHSAQVARLMRKFLERIGVKAAQKHALISAGYLHDLGKMGTYHLTALNVAEYEGHRASATKLFKAPLRLMEAVNLPKECTVAVGQMYERFDGKGLPGSLSGKEISLGARLLAIADTYADLTQNPRNPFRKTLRPVQACEVLSRYAGSVFDPNLVDLFRHTVTGDDLKARLLANRHRALVVDHDAEETTVLELRLIEQGFEVEQARTSDHAMKLLTNGEFDVVVSELELEPQDGFALLAEARKQSWGKQLPWVVMSSHGGRTEAQRAFEMGALDFVTKPVSADLLVAKIRQILEREASGRGARGVNGSLTEMGLPDMVQVLWHGRKTGSLRIRSGGETGEIHFVDGAIFNAMWANLRGEDAFYAMLGLKEGEFALDPNHRAPQQVMQASPEALLLEGMRRIDEGSR